MSTSGSKSNEHVAHFLVDIHILGNAYLPCSIYPNTSNTFLCLNTFCHEKISTAKIAEKEIFNN